MNMQNRSIVLLFLVLANLVVYGQDLIPYYKGNLQGFCTTDKNLLVKPQYERVTLFKKGYAFVVKDNKLGMINKATKAMSPTASGFLKFLISLNTTCSSPNQ